MQATLGLMYLIALLILVDSMAPSIYYKLYRKTNGIRNF